MISDFKALIRLLLNKRGIYIGRFNIKFQGMIREIEGLYSEFVFRNFTPSDDKRLELMFNLTGTGIGKAIHILNYLDKSLELEGDICEFGVAQGSTSALMAYEIRNTNKNIWLFDSFKGLPKPTEKDSLIDDIFNLGSMDAYKGKMACGVNQVTARIRDIGFPFNRVNIVSGFIEKTIELSNLPDKVCFAYVDFDFYEPTSIALVFLNKVLQVNGFIIVDDYNFFSTGCKIAVEEFMADNKGTYSLTLPLKSAGKFCILQKIF
jgi:hypothetical protein